MSDRMIGQCKEDVGKNSESSPVAMYEQNSLKMYKEFEIYYNKIISLNIKCTDFEWIIIYLF